MVTAGGSRSDIRGNVRCAGVRSIVDSHADFGGNVNGVGLVDDVGLDDRVGRDDGRDDGLGDGDDGLDDRGNVSVDLGTLGIGGELVKVTAGLGGSALQGVGSSILDCELACAGKSKHQVTYLRDRNRSVSRELVAGEVANLLLSGVDDLASLQGDGTLSGDLIFIVARRHVLDDRLASLQRVAGAAARGDGLSGLSGRGGSGRLGLGLDSDGLRLIVFVSLGLFGLDSSSLLAASLLGGGGSNGSVFGVGFSILSSISVIVISVSLSLADLALQLVIGSVGRSTSLVAADGSKLVKVDLKGELARSHDLSRRFEIDSRWKRAKGVGFRRVVVKNVPPLDRKIVIGEDRSSDKA